MLVKILSIINIIIAVQAIFLVFHFFFKRKGEKILNILLGLLCFCFAILSIRTCYHLNSFLGIETLLLRVSLHVAWFIGPLLFLYVLFYEGKLNKRIVFFNTTPYVFIALFDIIFNRHDYIIDLQNLFIIQIIIYLMLIIRHCFKNYRRAKQFYSWILPSLFTMSFLISFYLVSILCRNFGIDFFSNGLMRNFKSLLVIPVFYIAYKEMNSTNEFGIKPKKYKTSPLSREKREMYLKKIEKIMREEKLFLNKNLTLQIFSKLIGIQSKYISQVINQNLDLSFSEYLLQYRIEEVKKNLFDPKKANLTIYGIAQDSGFSSNSRFNYLFKKDTGLTPKQFRTQKR
ncbi:helix-turn-helix domain-containing protein [Winogradskyella luteola]|uniref:Helix-turn-helix transcriptional regulator n=1 Tax=Winogradskyella luteola TaxID=2828330 RepID=A0A9X1F7U8_9FLAO|nr:helix-turn-helix domain-containing protein [Winogradskyella luteola]MBV7268814.1 helix-turn-helix transcriptional regulator [Winogradskyella luteola]